MTSNRISAEDEALANQLSAIRGRLNSDPQAVSLLSFLADRVDHEQAFYWQRFYAFTAWQSAAFLLSISNVLPTRLPIAVIGLLLAGFWLYVQWLSCQYVERLKPLYHQARMDARIYYEQPEKVSEQQHRSSTKVALVVPLVVALGWLLWGGILFVSIVAQDDAGGKGHQDDAPPAEELDEGAEDREPGQPQHGADECDHDTHSKAEPPRARPLPVTMEPLHAPPGNWARLRG